MKLEFGEKTVIFTIKLTLVIEPLFDVLVHHLHYQPNKSVLSGSLSNSDTQHPYTIFI